MTEDTSHQHGSHARAAGSDVNSPSDKTVMIDAGQLERIIASQRLTIVDGVKVGCGIYILLPLLIAAAAVLLSILAGWPVASLLHQ